MIICIDASNIRAGGGITHLKELLDNANPNDFGFNKVVVFSNIKTLNQLKEQVWLEKRTHPLINKSLFYIIIWQVFYLKKLLAKLNCDLLFCPAATYLGRFKPYIVILQNLLIFDKKEAARYKYSFTRIKYFILNKVQSLSITKSSGIIFLSEYGKEIVSNSVNIQDIPSTTIPHGISPRFIKHPKAQENIENYDESRPFKLLYISTVDVYKHQWNVIEAVTKLNKEKYPLELTLIGAGSKPSLRKLNNSINSYNESFVNYLGVVKYDVVDEYYNSCDAFIFASTCETFPNILVEAMASGSPILSSNYGTMEEIYGSDGLFMNPLNVEDIVENLRILLNDRKLREKLAVLAFNNSKLYNWEQTASRTFSFFNQIVNKTILF